MNCERAEGYLSAFLDGALDSRLNEQVRAHLAQCAHCREILDDFRSFDHLLATQPRIEPPESLRARIFESDEYQRILEERTAIESAMESGAADLPDMLDPGAPPSAISGADPGVYVLPERLDLNPELNPEHDLGQILSRLDADRYGSDEVLPRLVGLSNRALSDSDLELDLDPNETLSELAGLEGDDGNGDVDAPHSPGVFAFARAGAPLWSRMALPAAAVLMISLATALMMKQGLVTFSSTPASGVSITLGNPGNSGIPLAAGPRVVYLHDGILWSASESGPGLKQPLTASGSSGVTVGNWSVSPNGQFVAYVDLHSDTLHVVRSDGLSDHVVATNVIGGIAWSPDGARIAYLTGGQGKHVLHIVKTDGTADLTPSTGGDASSAVWSSDSQWVAFSQVHWGTASIWSYNVASRAANLVTGTADATDGQASVAQLAWLPDMGHPAVTWATADASGVIEGIYSRSAQGTNGNGAALLSPAGAHYTAAAYTQTHSGAWLVANGNALSLLSANGTRTVVATLDVPASHIVWSATGAAAVTHGAALSLWTADSGLVAVDTGLSGIAPVWSGDGTSLLYAKTDSVQLARMTSGKVGTMVVLQAVDVNALGIAPDSQSVALATSGWVVVTTPDGLNAKIVDHHAPQDGHLVWSVAG